MTPEFRIQVLVFEQHMKNQHKVINFYNKILSV